MIITCPNCSARYKVKDELIQAKGKRVKCKKCEAVFLTYPDKDPVLESVAPAPPAAQSAPAPKPPVAPAAPPEPTPLAQATVKVDRSQLDKFLQGNNMDGTQSTLKVDPDHFKKFLSEQKTSGQVLPGATVQVDRSQIEAFMKESGGRQAEPSASETVQLDPSALSALAQSSPDLGTAQTLAIPRSPLPDASLNAATAATLGIAPAGPKPPVFAEPAEPQFPSDEELGIGQEDDFQPPAPVSASPMFTPPPQVAASAPAPAELMFQAEVEGQVYPNLPLESIARWVREGRLLEKDLVALNGTQNYQAADSFPEIQRFFQEVADAHPEPKPAKKGFFARLFSFGK